MTTAFQRTTCRVLVVSLLALSFQAAREPAGGSMSAWGWVAVILVISLVWYYAVRK